MKTAEEIARETVKGFSPLVNNQGIVALITQAILADRKERDERVIEVLEPFGLVASELEPELWGTETRTCPVCESVKEKDAEVKRLEQKIESLEDEIRNLKDELSAYQQ